MSSPLWLPASKRHKTDDSIPFESSEESVCLLTLIPECKRKVTAFLTLQEALSVRRAHRRLHDDDGDAFRYSALFDYSSIPLLGNSRYKYWHSQCKTVVSLMSRNSHVLLPALLRNETVSEFFLSAIFRRLIDDHGDEPATPSSIALLLKDGRYSVSEKDLDDSLKSGYDEVAAVLQQDERLKPFIKTCISCDEHVGCFRCAYWDVSCEGEIGKYCHSCVSEGPFCPMCCDYICSDCINQGKTYLCCECGNASCCRGCSYICDGCGKRLCEDCCTNRIDERTILRCGACARNVSESEGDY